MTTIFVESVELRNAAERMNATIRSMNEIQNAIARIDNNATSHWQGRAATQNMENFHALNNLITSYLADAHGTREALNIATSAYEITEQKQLAGLGQLSTEGIFQ
jgi:hypothetical protein